MIRSPLPLLAVIAVIIFLAATRSLFSTNPIVIVGQLAAIGLSIWSRRSFPPAAFRVSAAPGGSTLIRRGPYRIIRHPMYAAALLFIWTAILSHLSTINVAIGLVVTSLAAARVIAEERLLRQAFPDYAEYASATKAVIPFVV